METQNENMNNSQNENIKVKNKKEKKKIKWEIFLIGWAGTILIMTAYSLNSLGYLPSENIAYPILNLFGAIFLAIRVYVDRNWSNLFLEFFWGGIAIVTILKYFNLL